MTAITEMNRFVDLTKTEDNPGLDPEFVSELEKKMSKVFARMFTKHGSDAGGNPFLFSIAAPKRHYLTRHLGGRGKCKVCKGTEVLPIAATNGKVYYWNPEFLKKASLDQIQEVMCHETYHVLLFHCNGTRSEGRDPYVWNYAVDYVVNSMFAKDREKYNLKIDWVGQPISIPELKAAIRKQGIKSGMKDKDEDVCDCAVPIDEQDWTKFRLLHDPKAYGRTPEDIYDEIMKEIEKKGGCDHDQLGIISDTHIPQETTVEEVMAEMLKASETAKMMGSNPEGIEDILQKLMDPQLSVSDIVQNIMYRNKVRNGVANDWKRFKRRPLHIHNRDTLAPEHRLYMPTKKRYVPNWVAMLDTSGSMSDADMVNGVKELKLVANLGGECLVSVTEHVMRAAGS